MQQSDAVQERNLSPSQSDPVELLLVFKRKFFAVRQPRRFFIESMENLLGKKNLRLNYCTSLNFCD
jgi:hypothetical protein